MRRGFFICIIIIIILIIGSLIIIKKKKENHVDIKIFYVDNLPEEEKTMITFCAVNKYHDFDLIEIEIPKDVDIYQYVFELYNYKRNALPLNYNVYSKHILELESLSKEGNIIYLKIKDQKIPPEEFHWTIYALKVTYKYLGIEKLIVDFNNKEYIY
ncbi:MAG TPA: hypothetical protein GXZ48_02010 [Acholeplasmataceae bacterium]|nr:hypothetical protein [Acholeplasmataceae bacterium]